MSRVRTTLRYQLLRYLMVPLAVLWTVDAVLTHVTVRRAMNAAYDRSLYASALAISEHVTLAGGAPVVDLPAIALEMLDTGEQERVFYRVSYRGAEGDAFITGYPDLPPPAAAAPDGRPLYYESGYRGDTVRIVALHTALPADPPVVVRVQVAETLLGRKSRARTIVSRVLGSQILLILIAGAVIWLGVRHGLRPLSDLSREVADRSPTDLTPLAAKRVPDEVSPLIGAIDQLMARVRDAIAAQRRFIADASHQLRTPLAVLRTQADTALRQQDFAAMRQCVVQLRDHSQATSHLASQLLSLARAEPIAKHDACMELLDLTALARDACAAMVPGALAREIDLGFEGGEPATIRGQAFLIREMLANLVDNAMRYGAPRGTITVSVARAAPDQVCLAVDDDGPGICEAERQRVFERFYRIPGSLGDGCGLGLSIVREIAQGHGATVHLLDRADGIGLRVEIRFAEARPR